MRGQIPSTPSAPCRRPARPASFVAQIPVRQKIKKGNCEAPRKNPAAEGAASGAGRLHDSNLPQCRRARQISSSQTCREHLATAVWLEIAWWRDQKSPSSNIVEVSKSKCGLATHERAICIARASSRLEARILKRLQSANLKELVPSLAATQRPT